MNRIIMAKSTFEENLKDSNNKIIGEGKDGKIFLTIDKDVVKVLKRPIREKKACQFENIKNDSFVFPKAVIEVDSKVRALKYDYVEGLDLSKFTPDYGDNEQIDDLIPAIKKLIQDIEALSEYNILVNDTIWSNIMWDKQSFKIVDTLHYSKTILNNDSVRFINLRDILDPIYNWMINKNLYDFLMNSDLAEEITNPFLLPYTDEVLLHIKDFLENYLEEKVNTFGEASKKLTLTKH